MSPIAALRRFATFLKTAAALRQPPRREDTPKPPPAAPAPRMSFEMAEPRVLLSGDISYVATGPAALELRIVSDGHAGDAPLLELMNVASGAILASTSLNGATA